MKFRIYSAKDNILLKIAEAHYGKGNKYALIVAANTPPVTNIADRAVTVLKS